jgi:hypothetical protein
MIPVFFGWPFLFEGVLRVKRLLNHRYATPALIVIVFVASAFVGQPFTVPLSSFRVLADYYPDFVRCIDEHTARYQIQYGISEYWEAKHLSLLSKRDVFVVQAKQLYHNSLFPQYWINIIAWYKHDFEFIITRTVQDGSLVLEPEFVKRRFGSPSGSFLCDEKTVLVYNRQEDHQFQRQFQVLPAFAEFKTPGDNFDFYACFFLATTGETIGLSRIANGEVDSNGLLIADAGIPLPRGLYRMTVHFYAEHPHSERSGRWYLLHDIAPGDVRVIAEDGLVGHGKGSFSHNVRMPDTGELRIGVQFDGEGVLVVNRIAVEKLE